MIVVGIHATFGRCYLALLRTGHDPIVASHPQASSALPCGVFQLVDQASIDPSGIDLLAVARGPGSFTGIKVSISCAWGISKALGVPLAGVGSLEALALAAAPTPGETVVSLFPAYGGLVYAARCLIDGQGLPSVQGDPRVGPPSIVSALVGDNGRIILAGSVEEESIASVAVTRVDPGPVLALSVARLAESDRAKGRPTPAEPLYLRADPAKAW